MSGKLKNLTLVPVGEKCFFDIRVIKMWNDLPANVVEKQTISSFKARLDRHQKLLRGDASTSE